MSDPKFGLLMLAAVAIIAGILLTKYLIKRREIKQKEAAAQKKVAWPDGYNSQLKIKALGIQGFDSEEQNERFKDSLNYSCQRIS